MADLGCGLTEKSKRTEGAKTQTATLIGGPADGLEVEMLGTHYVHHYPRNRFYGGTTIARAIYAWEAWLDGDGNEFFVGRYTHSEPLFKGESDGEKLHQGSD